MNHGIYVSTSGFLSQQKRLEMIANNLANANTAGFKGDVAVFETSSPPLTAIWAGEGRPVWTPTFVNLSAIVTDFSEGPLTETGNPLDVAIVGQGFFEIQTPQGPRYTRRGDFALTGDGNLVTQEGQPVMGQGGPITLTEGEIEIDQGGIIYVDRNEEGRLRVVTFPDTRRLVKQGRGLFAWAGGSSEVRPLEHVEVRSKHLENSNVNPVMEMVRMIETIRTYEAQQKVIHSFDSTEKKAVDEVGRLR
ncbi:MAG: flagellar basal-body rod protein FlgF [Deltaproteobacteria bacterium]|nr:flagellar basal-body rod protein FlgF [Deltaproteobacteria bacterium]